MSATTTSVKRWGAQDSLWLCLAIALHACLLLIPALQKDDTFTRTGPLNISFDFITSIANPTMKWRLSPMKEPAGCISAPRGLLQWLA